MVGEQFEQPVGHHHTPVGGLQGLPGADHLQIDALLLLGNTGTGELRALLGQIDTGSGRTAVPDVLLQAQVTRGLGHEIFAPPLQHDRQAGQVTGGRRIDFFARSVYAETGGLDGRVVVARCSPELIERLRSRPRAGQQGTESHQGHDARAGKRMRGGSLLKTREKGRGA